MDVLIALGDNVFYAVHPSFERFKEKLEIDWRSQRRLGGRRPALQAAGPGDEILALEGVIYPEKFGNGRELLAGLRNSALSLEVMPLIEINPSDLSGNPLDDLFVITSVGRDREFYGQNGARKITFNVECKVYGSDLDGLTGGLF